MDAKNDDKIVFSLAHTQTHTSTCMHMHTHSHLEPAVVRPLGYLIGALLVQGLDHEILTVALDSLIHEHLYLLQVTAVLRLGK